MTMLTEMVRREPGNLHVTNLLASALLLSNRLDQALYYATRGVEIAPQVPAVHGTLGNCLTAMGRYAAGQAAYEKAWAMGHRDVGIADSLLFCLRQEGKWATGARFGKSAFELLRGSPIVAVVTSECLRQLGRSAEGLALMEPVVKAFPQYFEGRLAHATLLNYVEGRSATEVAEAHRAAAAVLPDHRVKIGMPSATKAGSHVEPLAAKRSGVMRVGLVSGDFRRHSCAWFVLPLLREAKRVAEQGGGLEFVLYSNERTQDDITAECKSLAMGWREVWTWNDAKFVEQVKADGIDVLIDLAGHTPGNRLKAFSMRAAPVQATWLGYPATTGVKEMDIRIVDWVTDPDSSSADVNVERTVRLGDQKSTIGHQPLFCFEPAKGLTDVGPGGASGAVFCCFNSLQKYSDAMLKNWAEILRRVPDSTLVIKAQGTNIDEVKLDLEARLREAALPLERVTIVGYTPTNESHLALYQKCDIHLDTFPYNGATTSCESLVMGVPVVTRSGETHASRVGASIVTSVYGERASVFISRSWEDYVEKAVGLARKVKALRAGRGELRQRVLASRLCDEKKFLSEWGAVLRSARS